jgi:pyruvate dehydrogenase complex dehydrogenase (E1) component
MGITVAVGRAIANPSKKVYCLISDGETAEGSIWEALRFIKEKNIKNIEIHCSCNGHAAYDNVDIKYLRKRLISFLPQIKIHLTDGDFFPFLKKLNAHYHIMSENDYKIANNLLA